MKALERALDVYVGEREYFEGEARTPGRGQELKEMEAEERWGGQTCQVLERGGLGSFLSSYILLVLARALSPSLNFRELYRVFPGFFPSRQRLTCF